MRIGTILYPGFELRRKQTNFLYGAFIALLIYNFVYPIRLNLIPNIEFFLYLLLLSQLVFHQKYFLSANRLLLFYFVVCTSAILLILSLFSVLLNSSDDLLGVVSIVKFVFAIVISYLVSLILIRNYQSDSLLILMRIIILSTLLISITCILEYFIPSVKNFLARVIATSGNIVYEDSFRVHGFATGGGASLSVGLAIGAVLSLFLAKKATGVISLFWAVTSTIIFVSTLFVGRTGFFLLTLFFSAYFINNLSVRSLLFAGFVTFLLYVLMGTLNEDQLNILYSYSLEPVKNYIEYGSFESKTTSALMERLYFPDVSHLIFGAGYWRYPTHGYMLSDTGYMKVLMAYGMFGFLAFYLLQLYIYTTAYKWFNRIYAVKFKFGFAFVFFVLFVVELKEEFFVQNYAFKILILLAMFAFTHKAFFKELKLK